MIQRSRNDMNIMEAYSKTVEELMVMPVRKILIETFPAR